MCIIGGPSTTQQRLKIVADQEEQSVGYMLRGDKQGADYLQLVCPEKLLPNQLTNTLWWFHRLEKIREVLSECECSCNRFNQVSVSG